MRVGIKEGGDGVRCWNTEAVTAYADRINAREAQIARDNPDVVVVPGQLICYGCEVMEYDYGVKCTAQLTRTRYAVQGEVAPRSEDAAGSLLDVPGLQSRAPAEVAAQASSSPSSPAPAAAPAPGRPSAPTGASAQPAAPAPTDTKRSGLRGLFGR